MRYISTEIGSSRKFGSDREIVKTFKDSGFTAYDYSFFQGWAGCADILKGDDYLQRAKEFRAFADGLGIVCNQTHAPFPSILLRDSEYTQKVYPLLVRAIEVSGVLGAKVCVVHPCNDYSAEQNAEFYLSLEEVARKSNVKIGVENMWNSIGYGTREFRAVAAACSHHDDFKKHLDLLPDDVFVACVDIGPAHMEGLDTSAAQIIQTLGSRVAALHLHDIDLIHDNHSLPFTQKIDYAPIITALKKVGYQGDITLEADAFFSHVPKELFPAAAKYAAAVANYFKESLEK